MQESNCFTARPRSLAAKLEAIARDAESVDASVPILCGLAANRLYAVLGNACVGIPTVTDQPFDIRTTLDGVIEALSELGDDPNVAEVLGMVREARRALDES